MILQNLVTLFPVFSNRSSANGRFPLPLLIGPQDSSLNLLSAHLSSQVLDNDISPIFFCFFRLHLEFSSFFFLLCLNYFAILSTSLLHDFDIRPKCSRKLGALQFHSQNNVWSCPAALNEDGEYHHNNCNTYWRWRNSYDLPNPC